MSPSKIEFADHLYGVRHWAYWDMACVPQYEVYRYIGRRGIFYIFQSIKRNFLFSATEQELNRLINTRILRPFCLTTINEENPLSSEGA